MYTKMSLKYVNKIIYVNTCIFYSYKNVIRYIKIIVDNNIPAFSVIVFDILMPGKFETIYMTV